MASAGRTVKIIVKMTLPAGKAAPQPPVGPRLGQLGLNIMAFCKDFNAATAMYRPGIPITTKITAYTDRSATFSLRSTPTSYLLIQAAGVQKGSQNPGSEVAGYVSLKHVYEIAKIKLQDEHLKHISLKSMCRSVISTADSCGIVVKRHL